MASIHEMPEAERAVKQLTFTPEKLADFRDCYEDARDADMEFFIFEGHEFVTAYAKYVIAYLESQGMT